MLTLSPREIEKLYKLNQDKECVEGLKKLFLKHFMDDKNDNAYSDGTSFKALKGLERAFKRLETISPEDKIVDKEENLV